MGELGWTEQHVGGAETHQILPCTEQASDAPVPPRRRKSPALSSIIHHYSSFILGDFHRHIHLSYCFWLCEIIRSCSPPWELEICRAVHRVNPHQTPPHGTGVLHEHRRWTCLGQHGAPCCFTQLSSHPRGSSFTMWMRTLHDGGLQGDLKHIKSNIHC